MTRRGLFVSAAIITATCVSLALVPMQMNALEGLGIWFGSVLAAGVVACAIAAAVDRHEHRAMYSQVLSEARKALR